LYTRLCTQYTVYKTLCTIHTYPGDRVYALILSQVDIVYETLYTKHCIQNIVYNTLSKCSDT